MVVMRVLHLKVHGEDLEDNNLGDTDIYIICYYAYYISDKKF